MLSGLLGFTGTWSSGLETTLNISGLGKDGGLPCVPLAWAIGIGGQGLLIPPALSPLHTHTHPHPLINCLLLLPDPGRRDPGLRGVDPSGQEQFRLCPA